MNDTDQRTASADRYTAGRTAAAINTACAGVAVLTAVATPVAVMTASGGRAVAVIAGVVVFAAAMTGGELAGMLAAWWLHLDGWTADDDVDSGAAAAWLTGGYVLAHYAALSLTGGTTIVWLAGESTGPGRAAAYSAAAGVFVVRMALAWTIDHRAARRARPTPERGVTT